MANILGIAVDKNVKREIPVHSILIADEVTAVMLAEFPSEKLMGIVSIRGSNNSHTAILARAMGVPAVMGLSNIPIAMLNDKEILLDWLYR